MTFKSKTNPWLKHQPAEPAQPLDMTPRAIIERHRLLEDAKLKGLIGSTENERNLILVQRAIKRGVIAQAAPIEPAPPRRRRRANSNERDKVRVEPLQGAAGHA